MLISGYLRLLSKLNKTRLGMVRLLQTLSGHIISQRSNIQFTKELERNNYLPFIDVLVIQTN